MNMRTLWNYDHIGIQLFAKKVLCIYFLYLYICVIQMLNFKRSLPLGRVRNRNRPSNNFRLRNPSIHAFICNWLWLTQQGLPEVLQVNVQCVGQVLVILLDPAKL